MNSWLKMNEVKLTAGIKYLEKSEEDFELFLRNLRKVVPDCSACFLQIADLVQMEVFCHAEGTIKLLNFCKTVADMKTLVHIDGAVHEVKPFCHFLLDRILESLDVKTISWNDLNSVHKVTFEDVEKGAVIVHSDRYSRNFQFFTDLYLNGLVSLEVVLAKINQVLSDAKAAKIDDPVSGGLFWFLFFAGLQMELETSSKVSELGPEESERVGIFPLSRIYNDIKEWKLTLSSGSEEKFDELAKLRKNIWIPRVQAIAENRERKVSRDQANLQSKIEAEKMRLHNSRIIRDELDSLRITVSVLEAMEDLMTAEEEEATLAMIELMQKEMSVFYRR